MINNIIDKFYLVPIIPIIFFALFNTVNYFNVIDLEKKFMTNSKKLKIHLSFSFIFSLVLTGILLPFIMNELDYAELLNVEIKNISDFLITLLTNNQSVLLLSISFVFIFFICFMIILFSYVVLWITMKVFNVKSKFSIELFDEEKWFIYKMINKNELLLKNECGNYQIISDLNNKKVIRHRDPLNAFQEFFYKSKKRNTIIIIVLLIFSTLSFFCLAKLELLWLSLLNYLILLFLFSSAMLSYFNSRHIKQVNKEYFKDAD